MILHSLMEYYERLADQPESPVAPVGWEKKEIPFLVVLTNEGKFVSFEDTREKEGRGLRAKEFLVPQGVKKTSGIAANLLWDTAAYVFGVSEKGNPRRLAQQKKAFLSRLKGELGEVPEIATLIFFLENVTLKALEQDPNWAEIAKSNPNLSFRFSDDLHLICRRSQVAKAINEAKTETKDTQVCLVTGKKSEVKGLHTAIKGVYGAQTSGGNIISFNLPSFESYGKKQGLNAPVSAEAEFAYTTGLNYLLRRGSKQRMNIGDATVVFWSNEESSFEADFGQFFSEPAKDDPEAGADKIRALINSVDTGAYLNDRSDLIFNILGLSPNAARLSVRFWHTGTIEEFAKNIKLYFDDFTIEKPSYEPKYYSIWRILVNLAVQGESKNIPPKLAGELMHSILTGAPYPATLLTAALRRIQSDVKNRVTPVRAATIKAYLERYNRFYGNKEQEVRDKVVTEQKTIGHHLGSLFAILEKIQEEADPNINATILQRYYGAACASPVTVFANLLRLSNHHLAKLESKGRVINFKRMLGETMSNISDFPAYLDLHEQGRFALGYYQQRQKFFTAKDSNKKTEEKGAKEDGNK